MTLFNTDLYRQFGLGFLIGAAALAVVNAGAWSDQILPPAQAAEVSQVPMPAPEFIIEPIT